MTEYLFSPISRTELYISLFIVFCVIFVFSLYIRAARKATLEVLSRLSEIEDTFSKRFSGNRRERRKN